MKPGTVIVLNGTSSSGKTTLLRALQTQLATPYLEAGIDKFIFMLPKRYLDWPLWDDVLGRASEAGEMGHTLFSGMHHAIAALARTGNNVLADHVLVEPAWVRECAELFAELPAYLIGVRCPLEVMNAREAARGDRTLGQAAKQFHKVHAHGVYDLEVDTSVLSVEECAAQIEAFVRNKAPTAFARLRDV
jgi:chloramphenicol 3-O phosphotransferase